LAELAAALNAGQVQTLVILGGNPAYNAPADLNWPQAQAKAKTVIRLGYYEDETSWNAASHPDSQWDLPMAHYLESWGDARTADGTLVPIQPLIEPLFGGITEMEVLALIGGLGPSSPTKLCAKLSAPSAGQAKTIGANSCMTDSWPTARRPASRCNMTRPN
jgi:anaerobic selenocysteine-containing dehydrogenase